jgi:hypothetical protein
VRGKWDGGSGACHSTRVAFVFVIRLSVPRSILRFSYVGVHLCAGEKEGEWWCVCVCVVHLHPPTKGEEGLNANKLLSPSKQHTQHTLTAEP